MLAAAQPKKLYILLGTNTLTTVGAADRFLAYYGQMLDVLRQTLGETASSMLSPSRPSAPRPQRKSRALPRTSSAR